MVAKRRKEEEKKKKIKRNYLLESRLVILVFQRPLSKVARRWGGGGKRD